MPRLHCKANFWKRKENISITARLGAIPQENVGILLQYNIRTPRNHTYFHFYRNKENTARWNADSAILNHTFAEIYYVYVNGIGGIVINNYVYSPKDIPNWKFLERLKALTGSVVAHYPQVIVLGYNECTKKFGHLVEDVFQPLLMMPQDVIDNAYLLCIGLEPILTEFLDLYNFPKDKRISLKDNEYISCDKVYIFIKPLIYLNFYGKSTQKLKMFFDEKFNLSRINATQYFLSNRQYKAPRYIKNFNDVCRAVKHKYPNINWVVLQDKNLPLRESSSIWASILFLFMPTGSNIVNCMFMKDNTVIVIVGTVHHDYSIGMFVTACNIFSLQYTGLNCNHLYGNGASIDIYMACRMIGHGLNTLKNREWKL